MKFSNCSEIPIGKLPLKPIQFAKHSEQVTVEPIEEFLKHNSPANERMKKLLEETVEQIQKESQDNRNVEANVTDKKFEKAKSAGLSTKLIAKVLLFIIHLLTRFKKKKKHQKHRNMNKQTNNNFQLTDKEQKPLHRQPKCIQLCVKSQMYFMFNQLIISSLQIKQFNQRKVINLRLLYKPDLEEIADTIKILADLCRNWMTIIKQSKGIIISFNKAFDLKEIFHIIDEADQFADK